MEFLGEYILRLCAAAILCALVRAISEDWKGHKKMLDLVCGLVMLTVFLEPLGLLSSLSFENPTAVYRRQAENLVQESQASMKQELESVISERARAYIMDKAEALGMLVEVQVEVGDDFIPCGVTIHGAVSPYARTALSSRIEGELGISKEAQVWSQ